VLRFVCLKLGLGLNRFPKTRKDIMAIAGGPICVSCNKVRL
jgi:hypothetical protein